MDENVLRREILKILYDYERINPGDFVDYNDIMSKLNNIETNQLIFNMDYLENRGYLKQMKLASGGFLTNITCNGIDLIENKEEFNTKFPLINITNVHNSQGVVLNSNNVKIDINESINITESFNELYKQIDSSDRYADEIKEKLDFIKSELTKKEIKRSNISNSVEWLRKNANWSIPMIAQIITSIMMGNGIFMGI